MPAGSVVIELLAKTGSLETDIDRATRSTEKRMKEMQRTVQAAGAAMGLSLAGVGAAVAYMAKQTIDGLDKLNDVADVTGASIENISALEDVALRTGNSFESVETALIKFNAALKGSDDDGKAARALEAIGLRVEDLRKLDPAEALLQTAQALAKFADDGDKARLVQELFGKSVREVGPFLKDLAEKGSLVATVTTEQAKAAEEFNKQLAAMRKNSEDLHRALVSDLVTGINEAANALRQSGLIEGFRTLFTGTDRYKADKRLAELTGDLLQVQNELDAARANDARFGDRSLRTAAAEKRLAQINAEIKATQALRAVTEGSFFTPPGAPKPSVPAIPEKAKAGPKGPDPDADFKQYLNQLEQQIQKVGELTAMEKLLDDIRRGHLTVTPKQEAQLKALAGEVDATKDALRIAKERAEFRKKDNDAALDAANAIEEADARRLRTLLDGGPAAQLEKQRKEMEYLAAAFEKGTISAEEFNDAATGYLHLTGDAVKETKSMTEELGMTFASAFENAVIGGSSLSDVFKGLLQDIARVILRMQVIEPLMKQLKDSMGADGDGWWKSLVGSIGAGFGGSAQASFAGTSIGSSGFGSGLAYGNQDLGGFFADGGFPPVGKASVVGERGPELFIPRTAGMIVPNSALRTGGGDAPVIVNQTTGRVDAVQRQPMPDGREAWILQELSNPNSKVSRTLQHRYNLRPAR